MATFRNFETDHNDDIALDVFDTRDGHAPRLLTLAINGNVVTLTKADAARLAAALQEVGAELSSK